MTTWVLVWIVTGFSGYPGNDALATGSAVFHSQAACEKAAATFKKGNKAYCFEDTASQDGK